MNTFTRIFKTAALFYCLAGFFPSAMADDIDIFVSSSGGAAAEPNVMMLVDNTSNWARNATNTCAASPSPCPTLGTGQTYNTSAKVGGNQLNAIIVALNSLYNSTNGVPNIGVGLSMFDESGNTQNGYVRFGIRNIGDASTGASSYNSLISILSTLDPNASATKTSVGKKDEAESLRELYQYFNNGTPGTLAVSLSGLADYPGNNSSGALPKATSTGANLTAYSTSGCGSSNSGCNYRSPTTSCSKSYIIYIVNHGNNNGLLGSQTYNGVTASPNIAPITTAGVTADDRWLVEWSDFLFKSGITLYVVDVGVSSLTTFDSYSVALQQAAKVGGGKYYALTDTSPMLGVGSLAEDLKEIFIEIQAVNSTFASVSLPINATTRTQNLNQVFIPMFRPDPDASPLWKGNLKQYQLMVTSGGYIELSDANGLQAVNPGTGFATPCAQSLWTTDSSTTDKSSGYWANVTQNPSPKGQCTTSANSVWSDSPDGSLVEKGGVAEVIRKGNNPSGSTTWNLNRTVYTQPLAGGSLAAFSSSSSGLDTASGLSGTSLSDMANFILGKDVNLEYNSPPPPPLSTSPASLTRPSLHGDTIHSQPLPVTYSGSTGVYIYYGSNDGMLRSVNAATGQEQWAFVAPEFYSRLNRLKTKSPLISYPNQPTGVVPTPTPKDYFFDGSIGLYQNTNNSSVWIYPTMRRGGRMLYAFDVTSPTAPAFKWKVGCPNLTNDTGCAAVTSPSSSASSWTGTNLTSIGQTWSVPNIAASVLGYTGPVIVMGGGYDTCEDANSSTPTCTSPKGAIVYVIDANTGALVASFPTGQGRSVVADVALIADATPGVTDHAYAVDTGGNIFRIDFKTGGPSSWVMNRVAYTNGSGRKFLYPPALFHNPGSFVYLALGSGDREHPLINQYPYANPVTNRFYVYRDDLTNTTAVTNLDNVASGSSVISLSPTVGCNTATTPTSNILPASSSNAWFLDLNQYGRGEQTVTSALIVSGMVTFSTNRPIPAASGSCSTILGEARGYFMNLFNGSGSIGVNNANCGGSISATFVGGGMPPSPVFANVAIGNATYPVVIGAIQRQGGANSPISPQQVPPTISSNRRARYSKIMGTD